MALLIRLNILKTVGSFVRSLNQGLRRRRLAWAGWLLPALLLAGDVQAEIAKEYKIKAAFVYNFTKFVEWPESRFADRSSPIVIGVLGRNPFAGELEKIVEGRVVNGRPLVLKALRTEVDAAMVHLIFVPVGEEQRPELAVLLAGHPAIVTVGESERFIALGGMITFVPEADKVRFTINLEAAEKAGLKLSAQLLKLASTVLRKS